MERGVLPKARKLRELSNSGDVVLAGKHVNSEEDAGVIEAISMWFERVFAHYFYFASKLFPIMVGVDGNVVFRTPGYDGKTAGSLLLKSNHPISQF